MAVVLTNRACYIVRVNVQQSIKESGWRYILHRANKCANFDGEILILPAGTYHERDKILGILKDAGFNGPELGDDSDIADWLDCDTSRIPDWLEIVDIEFKIPKKKCRAWKLRESQVYELVDFNDYMRICPQPIKSVDFEWSPRR